MNITNHRRAAMSIVDIDRCIETLRRGESLQEHQVRFICEKLQELLLEEPNVQRVQSPVSVVGDIHGQFSDLLELFLVGGDLPDTNYLFLGNYGTRNTSHSVETISLLALYKLKYPKRVTLLRGNHECRKLTQIYGLYTECIERYGSPNVWKYLTDMFDFLPLAALIDSSTGGKIFCVHGGISRQIQTLDQIQELERFREIPSDGLLTDLLWSDPDQSDKYGLSPRGAGVSFTAEEVKKFSQTNGISHILRSHQVCMDGYQVLWNDTLSTIWSAPDYLHRTRNVAAFCEVDSQLTRFYNTFDAAPASLRGPLRREHFDFWQ